MASIDVHGDVGKVEALESIRDTITVAGRGVLACLQILVGDQVGERIWLNDKSNGGVRVLLEDGNDGYSTC